MVEVKRETNETNINCKLDVSGTGLNEIDTGMGFFNHMLETFSKHSGIDINLICKGDLNVDGHHSVEDCGIVIGQALKKEIFPIEKIERFSNATIVMDEACSSCALDISNRSYLFYKVDIEGSVGDFELELIEEFFQALISNAGISCHLINERGKNKHHIVESVFKSFAVALRRGLEKNEKVGIPSTKGSL